MKFERTPTFDNDFKGLHQEHKQQFLAVVPDFNVGADAYVGNAGFVWPARLRVSRMASAPGIWELTWSFASPDGRATFEFVTVAGEIRVRWRRIGNHRIYRKP